MRLQRAFTLVELSIVLVILGLLVGGVLAGQSLIRAAELRAITTEYNQYITAMRAFRDKYFAIPGDMPNAVRYWGAQAGGTADGIDSTCRSLTTAATGTATCNGNGNGFIGSTSSGTDAFEHHRSWQHLANAGLVSGTFSGVRGSCGAWCMVPGINHPLSKVSGGSWVLMHASWAGFPHDFQNIFYFGARTTMNTGNPNAILTPAEAFNIDTKMDDGKPRRGSVQVTHNLNPPTANCSNNVDYTLSFTGVACDLGFIAD